MRFSEFYNKTRNTVQHSTVRKINTTIEITEEREKFFNGDLFKKYDVVESNGNRFRILEQCSNYYAVVDDVGNVSRKFASQLTKLPYTEPVMTNECFHGYKIQTEAAQNIFTESDDDVGMLKQLKEADKMDQPYKSKDKLTVAKIIADAVGIPHDAVSTPENLVSAAIRKAKKDPALMKNKDILTNMLQIAREVGIKYSDSTFEPKVNESAAWETEEDKAAVAKHTALFKAAHAAGNTAEREKHRKIISDLNNKSREAAVKRGYKSGGPPAGWKNESVEEMNEADEKEHFKNAMNRIKPEKRDAARKAYTTMRSKGHTHAAALTTMHNTFSESVEEIDEISRTTVDSYLEKSKESKPNTLNKVMTRFKSREAAYDRVHKDELSKIGKKNESVEQDVSSPLTLKDLRKKLKGGEDQLDTSTPKDDEVKTTTEPPASTMNGDRSNTHRKMLVNKLQGN